MLETLEKGGIAVGNAAVEGNRVIRVRATSNNTQSVGLSQKDVCLTNIEVDYSGFGNSDMSTCYHSAPLALACVAFVSDFQLKHGC